MSAELIAIIATSISSAASSPSGIPDVTSTGTQHDGAYYR